MLRPGAKSPSVVSVFSMSESVRLRYPLARGSDDPRDACGGKSANGKGARVSVDAKTVRKVARLARIAVREDEVAPLTEKLNGILDWVEQLNEVDVTSVEPMTSVTPMRLKRRADVVTDGDAPEAVLRNAPDAREGFYVVPKVVE